MNEPKKPPDDLIWFLEERAKELNCLYKVEELVSTPDTSIDDVCRGIIEAIPPGWQYPDICMAKVIAEGRTYTSPGFRETPWFQSADIIVQDVIAGAISVYYAEEMPHADDGPFLKEETKLLATMVDRLGHFLMYKHMKHVFQEYRAAREDLSEHQVEEWQVALNLLRETDHNLFLNTSRRMLNFLCWGGIEEAEELLQRSRADLTDDENGLNTDENRPFQKVALVFSDTLSEEIFEIASKHLTSDQLLSNIQMWLQEERLSFLVRLVNQSPPLGKVIDAIQRYHHMSPEVVGLPAPSNRAVQVSLIRRLLSEQLHYIKTAAKFIEIADFYDMLAHVLYSAESYGRLGGKSAGLFLAEQIIKKSRKDLRVLGDIRVPKTWYLTSDGLLGFLNHNNLNEVMEQTYKDINQVRLEYPRIVQTLKNCSFRTDIIQGLSMLLDDFDQSPLIVRSSSLLEDRMGASFSGKYKSLFLANQGSKQERLEALTDAIAEVYASVFGPDPISYREQRQLLDCVEEMGIMIQKVVGTRVGDYFMPTFAGVIFSRNEFRWSTRIGPEDGLLRLVPGLGTRAVDRTSDDYPVLIAARKPGLRVNVAVDEIVRYAPRDVDVINLKTNTFETVGARQLLKTAGHDLPGIEKIVSIYDGQQIRKPVGKAIDFDNDDLVVTFDGLINDTDFISKVQGLLELLETELETPVDIEFASDGKHFYLLQCRAQSYSEGAGPAPIPRDIPNQDILFRADRYVSNGRVPDVSHIIYVDPRGYEDLAELSSMRAVAQAIGRLNKLLPKRKFILMGPGRWGSRGDIKLGVKVTYSDISNTAVLIEIARRKGDYVPDLSFGTHFFQDLVEAEIRYLPLYPDSEGAVLNEAFLKHADNILPEILPEFASISDTLKVIDVPKTTDGLILRVLMNADLDRAIGFLAEASTPIPPSPVSADQRRGATENFWAWRLQMAAHIASQLDPGRFAVKAFYIFGSTKNATAGPGSDIDILIHFQGSEEQHQELLLWLEGWSLALAEINYLRTGYKSDGLLDVHIVTDDDIAKKTSYAAKIGAVTDPARPLSMMKHK
jgi:predicted nucleotidyltransferase